VGSGVFALYWYWARPTNPVENRLREINPRVAEETQAQPVSTIIVEQVAKRLDQFTPAPSPRNVRRLRRRLIQAGYYDENAVTVFRVIRLVSVVAFPVATIFLTTIILGWSVDTTVIGLTLVAVFYGLFLPSFFLSRMISNRQGRITRALPDALDLMVVCVEAGLGFDPAGARGGGGVGRVVRELCGAAGMS